MSYEVLKKTTMTTQSKHSVKIRFAALFFSSLWILGERFVHQIEFHEVMRFIEDARCIYDNLLKIV